MKECLNVSAVSEPMNAREAYYRRMAQRYRELAAGSPIWRWSKAGAPPLMSVTS